MLLVSISVSEDNFSCGILNGNTFFHYRHDHRDLEPSLRTVRNAATLLAVVENSHAPEPYYLLEVPLGDIPALR